MQEIERLTLYPGGAMRRIEQFCDGINQLGYPGLAILPFRSNNSTTEYFLCTPIFREKNEDELSGE